MTKKAIMVSEIFLVNEKRQFLLQLRDDSKRIAGKNKWNILGGRVRDNESFRECIIREVAEEISVALKNPWLIDKVIDYNKRSKYSHYIFYDFIDSRLEGLKLREGKKLIFLKINKVKELDNKVAWFDKVYSSSLKKLEKILT